MLKRNRKRPPIEPEKTAADYYKLNLKAVDDLVNADVDNSPKVSQEELRKYRSGMRLSLPDWLKIVLIKAWFAGSVCFFFLWGLGNYVVDQLDRLFIVALALGVVTDLLTNNVFRFIAKTPGAHDRWMMFPRRGYWTLPLNILYAMLLMFCVVNTYNAINVAVIALGSAEADSVPLGVGPILFGVFATCWDLLFITMKRTLLKIVSDAKTGENGNRR